ncbi:MAG: SUF system NifU family Fe-S cluster assembly protein [Bdellovibrionales bacterium]|nr:SUF system NifU family Fe-S cluster assembly protein [Bdellovibrionales bacterium]
MSEHLDALYKDIILDHHKDPRNFGPLPGGAHVLKHEGYNPLCGDRVVLELDLAGGRLQGCNFHGEGCSICMSSASLMTEDLKGKPVAEALAAVQDFRDLMQGTRPPDESSEREVEALAGVRKFPVRIKCALLPWTTLKEALELKDNP